MSQISCKHRRIGHWLSLVGLMLVIGAAVARGGVVSNSPLFPTGPMGGVYYVEVDPSHPMLYAGPDPLRLMGTRLTWNGITTILPPGYTQLDFPTLGVEGEGAVDFGADSFFDVFFDVTLSGSMSSRLSGYNPGDLGTFPTEIIALDATGVIPLSVPVIGGTPLLIRESPTLASTGQTTIQDLGGGLYRIDSFFDIFTELSLDNGESWIPSSGSTPFGLVPEPSSIRIAGIAVCAIVLASGCRRWRAAIKPDRRPR